MKPNLSVNNLSLYFVLCIATFLLSNCKGNQATDKKDTVTKNVTSGTSVKSSSNADSAELTALVRKLYKWHEKEKMAHDGFKPVKTNSTDTAYSGIDLEE